MVYISQGGEKKCIVVMLCFSIHNNYSKNHSLNLAHYTNTHSVIHNVHKIYEYEFQQALLDKMDMLLYEQIFTLKTI